MKDKTTKIRNGGEKCFTCNGKGQVNRLGSNGMGGQLTNLFKCQTCGGKGWYWK